MSKGDDYNWNEIIQAFKDAEKGLIEFAVYAAKINHHYYTELKGRGFTTQEAIELVKATGLTFPGGKGK